MTISGGTLAARAATSRQAKQKLVDVLFGHEFRKLGPEDRRKLDYSIYKYDDLKKAYYERLHLLHPDKQRNLSSKNANQSDNHKREFILLQEVWSQYDKMAKSTMVGGLHVEGANFTLFGVGCSFSDNEAEKAVRSNITDQACRGWFPSGFFAEQSLSDEHEQPQRESTVSPVVTPLIDDSLFVESTEELPESNDSIVKRTSRRTLVSGME
jgi:hypothetical protein